MRNSAACPKNSSNSSTVPIHIDIFGLDLFFTPHMDRFPQFLKIQPYKYPMFVIPTLWTATTGTVHRIMKMGIATQACIICLSLQWNTSTDMKRIGTVPNVDAMAQQRNFHPTIQTKPEVTIITATNKRGYLCLTPYFHLIRLFLWFLPQRNFFRSSHSLWLVDQNKSIKLLFDYLSV